MYRKKYSTVLQLETVVPRDLSVASSFSRQKNQNLQVTGLRTPRLSKKLSTGRTRHVPQVFTGVWSPERVVWGFRQNIVTRRSLCKRILGEDDRGISQSFKVDTTEYRWRDGKSLGASLAQVVPDLESGPFPLEKRDSCNKVGIHPYWRGI